MKTTGLLLALALGISLSGCEWMPGRPKKEDERKAPREITDFNVLFNQNCRGCHGDGTNVSATISLNDPLYLSIIPKERFREVVANGVPHSGMPGFLISNGGELTPAQVDILVEGIYKWAKNSAAPNSPAYSAPLGNATTGATTYATYCASCHGVDGKGVTGKAGALAEPNYLGLVTDQYLRTIVIAGRVDLGCPDYLSRVPGKPMSNQEIGDVVAWMAAQRRTEFGQPLTTTPAVPQP